VTEVASVAPSSTRSTSVFVARHNVLMARRAATVLTAVAVLWVAAIFAAPVFFAHGPTFLTLLIYQAGSLVCHQLPDRSFHLAGVQMPVCARCTGLYLSGAAGACAGLIGSPATVRGVRWLLAIAAAPTLLSVGAEWAGLAQPSALWRALFGLPLGAFVGWLLVGALRTQAAEPRPLEQMRYHA
jgi:uncharacterized membrane protein